MSSTRVLIVLTSVTLGLLVWYGSTSGDSTPPPTVATAPTRGPVEAAEEVAAPAPYVVDEERERQDKVLKKQLAAMKAALAQRRGIESIANQTRRRWEELRLLNEWKVKQLIDTNLGNFEALRILARQEADTELRCKICDGDAKLDVCTMCDTKGLCPSCDGIGRERFEPEKPCVACEGRGTCFLCAGGKRMHCVFCENGRITSITPWPSYRVELP